MARLTARTARLSHPKKVDGTDGGFNFLRIAFSSHVNSFGNVRGWVFGAWGETSEEVHTLDQKLAEFWPPPKIKKF